MAFFKKPPVDERRQRSQEQMAHGGLPLNAQERLSDLRRHGQFFTSNLSINEFALTVHAGFRPLGQVMGSTIYHVGWQYTPIYMSGELMVWTEAQRQARWLALSRLQQEAQILGAHAVLGVRLERRMQDWGQNLIEWTARGTAVAFTQGYPPPHPLLSVLSGQEYWTLHQGGYRPVGIAFGVCAYYYVATAMTQYASRYGGNLEMTDYTRAFYAARHSAMERLSAEATRSRAAGVVGVTIETDIRPVEVEVNDQTRRDLLASFTALGTAIAPIGESSLPIQYSLPLTA